MAMLSSRSMARSSSGQEDDKVTDKIHGDMGSQVTITVRRADREITRTLTREAVFPDNVWSRDLGDGIYAIVVTNFERQNTAFMIYDEIKKIGWESTWLCVRCPR